MLFHDAVLMAVQDAGSRLIPVGPPNRYEEIAADPRAAVWARRPCVEARGLVPVSLDFRVRLGGMNEFHAAAKRTDAKESAFDTPIYQFCRRSQRRQRALLHGPRGLAGWRELGRVDTLVLFIDPWEPAVPFKVNQDRRHHIPRQRHRGHELGGV